MYTTRPCASAFAQAGARKSVGQPKGKNATPSYPSDATSGRSFRSEKGSPRYSWSSAKRRILRLRIARSGDGLDRERLELRAVGVPPAQVAHAVAQVEDGRVSGGQAHRALGHEGAGLRDV